MSPEYRVFIPQEAQNKFEEFVGTIEGSQTWKRDSRGENYEGDELIGRVRGFFTKFSKDTIFQDSLKSEAWRTFRDTYAPSEQSRLTSTFRPIACSSYGLLTLEELSQMDWDQSEMEVYIRNIGPKRKDFVRKTMEGLTFPDSQPKSLESEN